MNRQVQKVPAGGWLRVVASSPFVLHWSDDEWRTPRDTRSTATALGLEYVDIQVDQAQRTPLRFTFNWPLDHQWQGEDFAVEVERPLQSDLDKRKAVLSE